MLSKLERAKLNAELLAVMAAKADFELKIIQREEEIERLKDNLSIQETKIEEIKMKLEG